jgi:hypothetical protein
LRFARATLGGALALALLGVAADAGPHRRGKRPPADAVTDRAARYQIVIAPGWRQTRIPEGTLAAYQSPGGTAQLTITRISTGTRWREASALAVEVERGVEKASPGYRRVRRRAGESAEVPTLELTYERSADPGRILSRYLFFTRYTVVATIGLGSRASRAERRAAESMLRSFMPYL